MHYIIHDAVHTYINVNFNLFLQVVLRNEINNCQKNFLQPYWVAMEGKKSVYSNSSLRWVNMQLHNGWNKESDGMVCIKRKPLNPIIRNLKIIFTSVWNAHKTERKLHGSWRNGWKIRRRRMNNEMPSSI